MRYFYIVTIGLLILLVWLMANANEDEYRPDIGRILALLMWACLAFIAYLPLITILDGQI